MAGEELKHAAEQESPQETEWDRLADGQFEDIEQVEESEEAPSESEPVEMTRRTTKLPTFIENARRDIVRRRAPNTMPSIERLASDASHRDLLYIDELCDNWPIFKETEKVNIEGKEVDFPRFYPEVKYTGGIDFVGYLSTADDQEGKFKRIKSEIGKKNASIYAEACLDNPLVATIDIERYPGARNSDYICYRTLPNDLKKARIRLIDESLPLSTDLQLLNARISGIGYESSAENEEQAECMDTVKRATIAYHEIGHAMDVLTNYMKIQEKSEVSSQEIYDAMSAHDKERAFEIECSRSIPEMALGDGMSILSSHEFMTILTRRGFDPKYTYNESHLRDFNKRCYREMPCESVADDYARKSVCVKHRDHYYAQNENERQQNPEKKNLPIYGEMIYLGTAMKDSENRFLDQELMNCGIVAGKRVVIKEMVIPEGLTVDQTTGKVRLPDDYDYHADQRAQARQPFLVEGKVRQNPCGGVFEVEDDEGNVCVIFGGDFRRQQNEMGKVELINGDLTSGETCYRVQFDYSSEDELAKKTNVQFGPMAFDRELGINAEEETTILFINDNSAARVLLPKGGFANAGTMIDSSGAEYPVPMELYYYNGIPKAKFNGQLFEVVPGDKNDLAQMKATIAAAKSKAEA